MMDNKYGPYLSCEAIPLSQQWLHSCWGRTLSGLGGGCRQAGGNCANCSYWSGARQWFSLKKGPYNVMPGGVEGLGERERERAKCSEHFCTNEDVHIIITISINIIMSERAEQLGGQDIKGHKTHFSINHLWAGNVKHLLPSVIHVWKRAAFFFSCYCRRWEILTVNTGTLVLACEWLVKW